MALPDPEPGLVIEYSFLWRSEFDTGLKEGRKYRPVVIVLSVLRRDDEIEVVVSPITHLQPGAETAALEIPARVKDSLGLDRERSWIIADQVNTFRWPGPDIRRRPGQNRYDYGFLPPRLFRRLRDTVGRTYREGRLKRTPRD